MTSKSKDHPTKQAFKPAAPRSRFSTSAAAAIGLLLFSPHAQSESLVDSALGFFGNDSNTPVFDLDKSRPHPVQADYRANVLNSLPKEGRVSELKEPQLRKL